MSTLRSTPWSAIALCMCVGCGTDHPAEGADTRTEGPATGTDAGAASPAVPPTFRTADAGEMDGGGGTPTTGAPVDPKTQSTPAVGREGGPGPVMDAGGRPELDASPMFDAHLGPDASGQPGPDDAGSAASDAGSPTQVIDKLRACNVVGEGIFNQPPIRDGLDRCRADCILSNDCQNVHAQLCEMAPLTTLSKCNTACVAAPPEDGFSCGDGMIVPHLWLCDQSADCPNGADEKDCGTFKCADGQLLKSAQLTCDGVKDCSDGSDEAHCAAYCP